MRSGRPTFAPDSDDHPLIRPELARITSSRSMYLVPVASGATVTGVLVVDWSYPLHDLDDRRTRVVAMLADHAGVALRQAMLLAELQLLALTDPLTSLPNRRSWDQQLEFLLTLAEQGGGPLTVALADLDHFKLFNDTHGHLAGDALLRDFADAARDALRTGDIVARWGGEEFAIALPRCPPDEGTLALERVLGAVPAHQTCSVGYATWDGTETGAELMGRVDAALYIAKAAGRNRTIAA
jgi:diguanylate cyclase (GGDEF)-like protein